MIMLVDVIVRFFSCVWFGSGLWCYYSSRLVGMVVVSVWLSLLSSGLSLDMMMCVIGSVRLKIIMLMRLSSMFWVLCEFMLWVFLLCRLLLLGKWWGG